MDNFKKISVSEADAILLKDLEELSDIRFKSPEILKFVLEALNANMHKYNERNEQVCAYCHGDYLSRIDGEFFYHHDNCVIVRLCEILK